MRVDFIQLIKKTTEYHSIPYITKSVEYQIIETYIVYLLESQHTHTHEAIFHQNYTGKRSETVINNNNSTEMIDLFFSQRNIYIFSSFKTLLQ